jgi:hypothetical protein
VAVRRIIASDNGKLDGQDRADLLFFMAVFVIRVPFFRHLVENFASNFVKSLMQVSANDPEYFTHSVREALKGKQDLTPDEIEDLRQWVLDQSKYTIRTSPSLSINRCISICTSRQLWQHTGCQEVERRRG